jgi:hypothetical protein
MPLILLWNLCWNPQGPGTRTGAARSSEIGYRALHAKPLAGSFPEPRAPA